MEIVDIGIRLINNDFVLPEYATLGSACFDLQAQFKGGDLISCWSPENKKYSQEMKSDEDFIGVHPGWRFLIPTGLIMDIPMGYSVRVHPRSGTSLKNGIGLINSEGVIDSDYTNEVFIPVSNTSRHIFQIYNGMKIAQAEVIPMLRAQFDIVDGVSVKGNRTGGFGSTGQ